MLSYFCSTLLCMVNRWIQRVFSLRNRLQLACGFESRELNNSLQDYIDSKHIQKLREHEKINTLEIVLGLLSWSDVPVISNGLLKVVDEWMLASALKNFSCQNVPSSDRCPPLHLAHICAFSLKRPFLTYLLRQDLFILQHQYQLLLKVFRNTVPLQPWTPARLSNPTSSVLQGTPAVFRQPLWDLFSFPCHPGPVDCSCVFKDKYLSLFRWLSKGYYICFACTTWETKIHEYVSLSSSPSLALGTWSDM